MRKDLLIAESELNRAQLMDAWEAATEWHRTLSAGARMVGSVASAAALLASGLRAFRRKRGPAERRGGFLAATRHQRRGIDCLSLRSIPFARRRKEK